MDAILLSCIRPASLGIGNSQITSSNLGHITAQLGPWEGVAAIAGLVVDLMAAEAAEAAQA